MFISHPSREVEMITYHVGHELVGLGGVVLGTIANDCGATINDDGFGRIVVKGTSNQIAKFTARAESVRKGDKPVSSYCK